MHPFAQLSFQLEFGEALTLSLIAVLSYALGLWLAYLLHSRYAQKCVAMRREQDQLSREWDRLHESEGEREPGATRRFAAREPVPRWTCPENGCAGGESEPQSLRVPLVDEAVPPPDTGGSALEDLSPTSKAFLNIDPVPRGEQDPCEGGAVAGLDVSDQEISASNGTGPAAQDPLILLDPVPAPSAVSVIAATPPPLANAHSPDTTMNPLIYPDDADPLYQLPLLPAGAANALIREGVTKFQLLAELSDFELRRLAGRHGSLQLLGHWQVRQEVQEEARRRVEPQVPPSAGTRERPRPVAPDQKAISDPPSPASVPAVPPVVEDDALTALDGIDALASRQLNEAGIHRYDQIVKMSPAEFEALGLRFMGMRKFSWPYWQAKLRSQAAELAGAEASETETPTHPEHGKSQESGAQSAQSAQSEASMNSEKSAESPEGSGVVEEVKEAVASAARKAREGATLAAESITNTERREALVEKGKHLLEEAGEKLSASAGQAQKFAGETIDDVKEKVGELSDAVTESDVARATAERLRATAVSAGKAATELRDRAKAFREDHLDRNEEPPTRDDREEPENASDASSKPPLSMGTRLRHFGDFIEAGVYGYKTNADDEHGFRYQQPPRDADDLTKLPGLEAGHASFLNGLGIYKLRQIASWTDANILTITREEPMLRQHDLRLWRAEARTRSNRSGYQRAWDRISDTARSTARFYFKQVPRGFDGEEVEMGPYGVVYTNPPGPALRDTLEEITGISPDLAAQLNGLGVYRFKQIATWSIFARRNIANRLELPESLDLQNWVDQAASRT